MKRKLIIAGVLILLISAGFTSLRDKDLDIVKNLDIYCTLFRELNMFYVDDTSPEELITTSINSMLSSLDPYTTYIPEKEMDNFNFQTTGEYGGIGSLIRRMGNQTIIADPYQGFPAARAGMRAGDILVAIDGKEVDGMAITNISDLLKGEPGTDLKITIDRPFTDEEIKLNLVREKIVIPNVPYHGMLNENTGYIKLTNFTTNAAAEVKSAYLDLKKNPAFNNLILDLRDNPGGLLIEAVRTCNLFIDKGETIVSTHGKVKNWDNEYKTTALPLDTEIPIAVMVNSSSASASEIVAGAMQDLDRAVLVGTRTFGKGLVQTTRPLKYNAQLKVTTAKYYIPSGRCIQALDYSHRNEDGSVGEIPDSLITEYETSNGRPVYDGGGIEPDIEVKSETYSKITQHIYLNDIFFTYATRFRNTVDTISGPMDFRISDEQYEQFKTYVKDQDFEYETASEVALEKLIETAKKEKYYSLSEEELNALEKKLSHDNLKDMETFKDEIEEMLASEIIRRYYYHEGVYAARTLKDSQLNEAINVISNPVRVQNILQGKEGNLVRK